MTFKNSLLLNGFKHRTANDSYTQPLSEGFFLDAVPYILCDTGASLTGVSCLDLDVEFAALFALTFFLCQTERHRREVETLKNNQDTPQL